MATYGRKPSRVSIGEIFSENLGAIVAASVLSIAGGVGLQLVHAKLYFLLPVLIAIPGLTDMIGDFSTIIASKSIALIEQGMKPNEWAHSKSILRFAGFLFLISIGFSFAIGVTSLAVAKLQGFDASGGFAVKFLAVLGLINLVMFMFLVIFSVRVGYLVAFKGHDPDNFLIPLATSLTDVVVLGLFGLLTSLLL